MSYEDFLANKALIDQATGLKDISAFNPYHKAFQRDLTEWALRRGRAAIWADCGLGKGLMAMDWAEHVPGDVLIVAPLAVSQQFKREAEKFGFDVGLAKNEDEITKRITVTNYDRLDGFDPGRFNAVVLDESSILKSFDGKTRTKLIEMFAQTPFRLCCSATPAPNDHMELGNHAEFLGVMTRTEMLAMFFVHDGGDTSKWRIKGHAQKEFWKWICSWAVMLRKPSDLGYDDAEFTLPPIKFHSHTVDSGEPSEGMLFALEASTLRERIGARSASIKDRVTLAANIANNIPIARQVLIWCNLNGESEALTKAIAGAVEVKGSDSSDHKEKSIVDFIENRTRCIVSKPTIFGYGLNLQNCSDVIFVGLSDSYEQFYQAVRRCWRFGQTEPVNVHIITAKTEGAVLKNIQRKESDMGKMADGMLVNMREINSATIHGGTVRTRDGYEANTEMILPSWI